MAANATTRVWDRGKVYKGKEAVAQVIYALEIVQEIISGLNQWKVTGQMRLLDSDRNLVADGTLMLHLCDGRQWEFRALDQLGAHVFRVAGTSSAGLIASQAA